MELSVDEKDLTQRKLEELQSQLQFLQKEKVGQVKLTEIL
jgi:hypothetical protein